MAGREAPLLQLQLAAEAAPAPQLLMAILVTADLDTAPLHYDDVKHNIH